MDVLFNEVGIILEAVAYKVEEGCLQPAETVVEAGHVRDGELEALGVSLLRIFVDDGAAGVGEPQDLGSLVEGLARRIVDGAPQTLHVEIVVDLQQERVAARYGEAEERERRMRALLAGLVQKIGQNMRLQVVHFDERYIQRVGHRLGKGTPDQQ